MSIEGQEPEAEQEKNWAKLRNDRDAWRTKAEALEEVAINAALLTAGFLPDSGEGKALAKAIRAGEVKPEGEEVAGPAPDPATVAAYAASEYGWQPQVALYGRQEAVQLEGHARLDALQQESTSEGPPPAPELDAIQAARERGDFATASALQMQYERRTKGRAG